MLGMHVQCSLSSLNNCPTFKWTLTTHCQGFFYKAVSFFRFLLKLILYIINNFGVALNVLNFSNVGFVTIH